MKLTAEQINKIDIILDKLGLDFLDFKLEIKDHIACEVEEEMKLNQSDFKAALLLVLERWENKLVLKESLFISNKRSFPKIVIDQLFKRFLIYNVTLVFSILTISIVYIYFLKNFEHEALFINSFKWIFGSCFLTCSVLKIKIYLTKIKTSYSYMFNQNFWLFTIYFFMFILVSGFMNFFLFSVFIVVFPYLIYSFCMHEYLINKYQLKCN